jgi:hypothetical protein
MFRGNRHGVTGLVASAAASAIRAQTLKKRAGQIDITVLAERSD